MLYDERLADRFREYLHISGTTGIEEKVNFVKMALLIKGKMCVNLSGAKRIFRFDPAFPEEIAEKRVFNPY